MCGRPIPPPVTLSQQKSPRQTCSADCAQQLRCQKRAFSTASIHDPKLVEKFTELWERGDTVKQIANRLGFSVNVVVGLRSRLHLKPRGNPVKIDPDKPRKPREVKPKPAPGLKTTQNRLFKPKKFRLPPEAWVTQPEDGAIGVDPLTLTSAQCCFPVTGQRPWRFCGAPVDSHGYCAGHVARVFRAA